MSTGPTLTASHYTFDAAFTTVFDYDGSGNVIYIGRAAPGTLKSAIGWQIQKYTYTGSNVTDIQFAGGSDKFKNVWDSRASYSYS